MAAQEHEGGVFQDHGESVRQITENGDDEHKDRYTLHRFPFELEKQET